jgi:hypothetical protein
LQASPEEALVWYNKALQLGAEQPYQLQAKMAEILLKDGKARYRKFDPFPTG